VKVAINDLLPMLAGRIEPYIANLALRMTQSGGSTLTVDSLETVKSEALREITETSGGNSQKEDEDEELVTANSLIAGQSSAAHWHSAQLPIPDLPRIYSSNNLLTAVLSGSLPQVRTILATGVSADSLSPDSLIRAVHGDSEMIRLLLDHGANPNLHSLVDGSTALIAAVSGGLTEVAQLILNGGVDVNATDTELWTALHHAANSGHLPVVRLLLRRSDIQVDAPAKDGDTPLVRAAWQGKDEIVSLLMERGADINFAMDPRKDTPLIRAAAYSEEGVVRLLLRHGADVDRVCEGRWTALLHAADTGNIVIAGLLLDHDADTEIETTVLKDTPLIKAAWHGHKGVVQLLLDHGADVTKKNKRGLTARHFMAGHLLSKAARDLGNLIWMSRISR
jgi:ankyrin repeat protein